jgi:hypothetical protein
VPLEPSDQVDRSALVNDAYRRNPAQDQILAEDGFPPGSAKRHARRE